MSDSFYEELEGLIGKHRQAEAEQKREEENEARFKRLEDSVGGIGKLIDERLPAKDSSATDNSESGAGKKGEEKAIASADPPPAIEEEPELEVERITRFTVPKIYTGDDEPEIVNYIDADTGETKTRKGRRKNRPTGYDVETVPEATTVEPEQIPTEPDEANG